jgi:hypothetical protein
MRHAWHIVDMDDTQSTSIMCRITIMIMMVLMMVVMTMRMQDEEMWCGWQ